MAGRQATPARAADVRLLIDAAALGRHPLRDAALIGLMRECAMRCIEVERLLWRDWSGDRIDVPAAKRGNGRVIPISVAQQQRLTDWRARTGSAASGDSMFGLRSRGAAAVLRRTGQRCGLDWVTGHSLRRGSAHDAAAAGMTVHQIQRIGGWRSSSSADRYIGGAVVLDGPPACLSTDTARDDTAGDAHIISQIRQLVTGGQVPDAVTPPG